MSYERLLQIYDQRKKTCEGKLKEICQTFDFLLKDYCEFLEVPSGGPRLVYFWNQDDDRSRPSETNKALYFDDNGDACIILMLRIILNDVEWFSPSLLRLNWKNNSWILFVEEVEGKEKKFKITDVMDLDPEIFITLTNNYKEKIENLNIKYFNF